MNHVFAGWGAYKGEIPGRTRGSLVAFEAGTTTAYGIDKCQARGTMYVNPGEEVYESACQRELQLFVHAGWSAR